MEKTLHLTKDDRLIIGKLLNHYEENWNRAPKYNIKKLQRFLFEQNMQNGVCWCSSSVFNIGIYYADWEVYFENKQNRMWAKRPINCETIEEVSVVIGKRIEILKQLSKWQNPS